jgi:hypothetical protein
MTASRQFSLASFCLIYQPIIMLGDEGSSQRMVLYQGYMAVPRDDVLGHGDGPATHRKAG